MLFQRRTLLLAGLVNVLAGRAFGFTPEPGPSIGQAAPTRPHITSATDRLKAMQERFGNYQSEAFKKGHFRARQDQLEQSRSNRK
jgi:hypothetical protein